ncbi:MAG: hypothetical protein JJU20_09400 [Opitutales bacterium]|nr:hypothetical protein [Opitutales bacterium]
MTASDKEHIKSALIETLRQGAELLELLSDSLYRERIPDVYDASIGGHYRHCLEHFQNLVTEGDHLDYDARKRDPVLETDREQALQTTFALLDQLEQMEAKGLARSVKLRCRVSCLDDGSPWVDTTLAREAVYAVVHAVHHYALIGVICRMRGLELPSGFGVAPSTVKYRQAPQVCQQR